MTIEETRKRIMEDDEFVLSEIEKIRYIYKLKKELRYNQMREEKLDTESVAEHVFGMQVIANYFLPLEDKENKLDRSKILQIITWHDIDEIETGDIVSQQKTKADIEREAKVLPKVISQFPEHIQSEVNSLLFEYEEKKTLETKFVKAIDKAEPSFEIRGDGYKTILHQNKTYYDIDWMSEVPYLKDFPYIKRFIVVADKKLLQNGFFVPKE